LGTLRAGNLRIGARSIYRPYDLCGLFYFLLEHAVELLHPHSTGAHLTCFAYPTGNIPKRWFVDILFPSLDIENIDHTTAIYILMYIISSFIQITHKMLRLNGYLSQQKYARGKKESR
jgi:hypothetical protein